VHVQMRVALEIDQPLAGPFARFVHLLKLEGVEPDAGAAVASNIDGQFVDGDGTEWVEAGGAFHGSFEFLTVVTRARAYQEKRRMHENPTQSRWPRKCAKSNARRTLATESERGLSQAAAAPLAGGPGR